jgi:hypothetical protein
MDFTVLYLIYCYCYDDKVPHNLLLDKLIFWTLHDKQGGRKLFTFQTYINHKVLEISGNRLHCLKEPLKNVHLN